MNQDRIAGQWKQLSGKIKSKWGKLTDDDLKRAEGNAEYLSGKVQERYGVARDIADKQVKEFQDHL
ncbi:MAG: CsbD family protein [Rudaea sp.]